MMQRKRLYENSAQLSSKLEKFLNCVFHWLDTGLFEIAWELSKMQNGTECIGNAYASQQ